MAVRRQLGRVDSLRAQPFLPLTTINLGFSHGVHYASPLISTATAHPDFGSSPLLHTRFIFYKGYFENYAHRVQLASRLSLPRGGHLTTGALRRRS